MHRPPAVAVERIGREGQPVIVIDDFVPEPDRLRRVALKLDYRPLGRHYPGVRAAVDPGDVDAFLAPVAALITEVFAAARLQVTSAAYSLVTTSPSDLTPIQRLPHFDGLDAGHIALLHYLGRPEQGGTAFYRHRATGFETITAERHAEYDAALHRDVARHGLPAPAYITGDTPLYECIARFAARPNRALIYRGHLLHCADLPPGLDFTADPATARLTVNTFLFART